ncbi:DUF6372 family protein [Nocardiopsis sp. FR26]|uniref:DUF6372 family protein n=1 Tax=Nocardiopsis sp. FR26 TaxID=2605987 RepID=UPI001359533D|nr:DUF6372 family protein [Nocardiopsis sp. FR26]
MRRFDITDRLMLADAYAERHGVDRDTALAVVNEVQRRGRRSPHYDDVTAPIREQKERVLAEFARVREHISARFARLVEAARPLAEWANSPEGRAQLEEWRQEREAEARRQSCHCACQISHGQLGVCTGEATRTLVSRSPALGRVDIPMCSPCADATLAHQGVTA